MLMASCQDKTVSVQHDCFLGSLWLHINWPSQLTVWWYCIAWTIQWSNKPNKWNMYSTLQRGKKDKRLGERQFSLAIVSASKLNSKFCWICLGLRNGMWWQVVVVRTFDLFICASLIKHGLANIHYLTHLKTLLLRAYHMLCAVGPGTRSLPPERL